MTIHERYPFVWKESRKKAVTQRIEEQKTDALQKEIAALALDTRSYNALRRGGIATINMLIDRWETLPRLKNFGNKSIDEVRMKLTTYLIDNHQNDLLERLTNIQCRQISRKRDPYVFSN